MKEPIKTSSDSEQQSIKEENKELVRRWIMTTDAQEFDSYDKFLSSDVVSHLPGSILNRIEIEQFERSFADAFPDASRTIEDLIAEDNKVVMRETFIGTHLGTFNGVPATGRKIQIGAIVIYRISNQKIVETWGEADFAGLMNQLTESDSTFSK